MCPLSCYATFEQKSAQKNVRLRRNFAETRILPPAKVYSQENAVSGQANWRETAFFKCFLESSRHQQCEHSNPMATLALRRANVASQRTAGCERDSTVTRYQILATRPPCATRILDHWGIICKRKVRQTNSVGFALESAIARLWSLVSRGIKR